MITKWKVSNFKSVRKATELGFAPLTIFAGANSSGKSTVLQSILLVAQTLSHKVSSRSVVLNGAFTRLGQFDDLQNIQGKSEPIEIGWTVVPVADPESTRYRSAAGIRSAFLYPRAARLLTSVSCDIAFQAEAGSARELSQLQPQLTKSELTVVGRDRSGADCRSAIRIALAEGHGAAKEEWLSGTTSEDPLARLSLTYDVTLAGHAADEFDDELPSDRPIGCLLRHFLPDRLSFGVDLRDLESKQIAATLRGEGGRAVRPGPERDIVVSPPIVRLLLAELRKADQDATAPLIARIEKALDADGATTLDAMRQALLHPSVRMLLRRFVSGLGDLEVAIRDILHRERKRDVAVLPSRPPQLITDGSWYLDQFFSSCLRYLGPLRDEPKALYPLAPTADPSDVGLKGEHTAAVLDLHKRRTVRYVPTRAFADAEIKPVPTTRTLEDAVVDWLQYLGVAEGVRSQDKGKFGHELKVSVADVGKSLDLTHVGVGVSQVLPILVASLLADPDTTLIFEQPELHLHPKVQTLLADFFLSMTVLGKQCIVETHSEYLINRIRFRAAAASAGNPWVAGTKVYFVERPEGGSTFREVVINEYGAVVDWPDGFFDQSQREAEEILRAAMTKKKAQRNQTGGAHA